MQDENDQPTGPASRPNLLAAAVVLILVVGLVISTALGYSIWSPFGAASPPIPRFPPIPPVDDAAGRVGERAVRLMKEGDVRYQAGDYEKALVSYRAAYEEAPDWAVANYSVAQVLMTLGRLREALPYAARAAKLDPSTAAWTAMHGYLLAKLEGPQAAWSQAETLRSTAPMDARDASWMAEFFDSIGDNDQELRAARAGLDFEPGATYLAARELLALVELNRLKEAGDLIDKLGVDKLGVGPRGEDERALSDLHFARMLYQMRVNPLTGVRTLCAAWKHQSLAKESMRRLVHMAERAGDIEATRAAVRRCLHSPETPGTAWASAQLWFPDTWTDELDGELAERIEPFPALLRLALYDPITDAQAIRRLAARIHTPDLFQAEVRDTFIFRNPLPGESFEQRIAALEDHLETNPDHVVCRLMLARMLVRTAPNRAAGQLEILDRAARDDPALAVAVARDRSEMLVGLDAAEQAVATIETVDPAAGRPYTAAPLVDLEAAEAAFHAGREQMLQKRLARVLESDDGPARAAALLIRWSDELATGVPITYREDVDRLLEQTGDKLLTSRSPSAQAILIAEGRPDARQREAWMPEEARGRLVLVRLFRDAAERGTPDLEAFSRLAHSPYPTEFAPLLAKTALARRRQHDAT